MTAEKVNICIVEDSARFRTSLKRYFDFTDGFQVVFDVVSVEEALKQLKQQNDVKIMLLDIGLPGMSGIQGIPHFKEIKPELDIVMLTSYEEEQTILKALCAGATSYITKRSTLEDIYTAMKVVRDGGSYMSPSIAKEIVKYFANGQTKTKEDILTARQKEIMDLMIHGKTYGGIAEHLAVSIDTVKSHIKKIYSNLQVNNKAEAIFKYMSA